jgi:crotonobetainyl-CoA:carnitine CoA-transferase CaiB-like acyl-CoA transferase
VGALEGVLVADFSRILSGPLATMLMGDLGATVVKVERPGAGDDTRAWGPPFRGDDSTYHLSVNRNKRSVTLDLTEPEDLELARTLALRADVLVENFRFGAMERRGLGYEDLSGANQGLVYCSISGFGRAGGAELAGYDFIAQATGGLMSVTGDPDGEPKKVGVALVDVVAGLYATVGILAALRARDRTGHGQRVDVNLLSSILAALANQSSAHVAAGVTPGRMGNAHPSIAPYETLRTADAPVAVAAGNDAQFAALCSAVGDPGLANDDRFATNPARVAHRPELKAALEGHLAAATADEWVTALTAAGVPCGRVNDIAQAFELARELELPSVVEIAREGEEAVPTVANPIGLSATPPEYSLPPPGLGEHGDEIRRWLAED